MKLLISLGKLVLTHFILSSCQTYEGGIAGEPGSEAHGGYTYCGLATMILINEVHRLDLDTLMVGRTNWLMVATLSDRQPLVFYCKDYIQTMILRFMDHHIYHKGQMKITENMIMMKMILKTVMTMMILMRTAMKVCVKVSHTISPI
ncbi:hypothetical protein AALP_AA6G333700 [Arabis alpina]|uniref:Prenyltransferase alpha-alpha toroid domain-containing protein n=1 Tax=Arabis alpina TaxID=50452 RepID=A0A087GTC0_ARAAL|nr:hypothetical protein AALP_AA6G333700 [Arabis alpina]